MIKQSFYGDFKHVVKAVIGIGGNLASAYGDATMTVAAAISRLQDSMTVLNVSSFYKTAPLPISDQPDYINAAVVIQTTESAQTLLLSLQAIENEMGRKRAVRWGARTLDLDLLAYDDVILPDEHQWKIVAGDAAGGEVRDIVIPHPRLHKRAFAALPFAEIYPMWHHPILTRPINAIAEELSKAQKIEKIR